MAGLSFTIEGKVLGFNTAHYCLLFKMVIRHPEITVNLRMLTSGTLRRF